MKWHNLVLLGKLTESKQFSRNRHNLPDNLGVVMVSKLNWSIKLGGVRMHYECAVFDAAARAQIGSVTLLKHIYRLLPKRLRSEIDRSPLAAIHKDKQSICQKGVKRVLFSTDPNKVI